MKAIWQDQVLAESDETIVIENNHYFPPSSINPEYLVSSKTETNCAWKGVASYYNIEVDGNKNIDAAWYYPSPKDAASEIKDYVAYWRGVEIIE